LLERLERDLPTHERGEGDDAPGREADRLLPVLARVEASAVHDELTREHLIEVHGHRLCVDRHDRQSAPYADDVGHGPHGGGMAGDLEGDVDAGPTRPLVGELYGVAVGADGLEPEPLQHLRASAFTLAAETAGAPMRADKREDGPVRSTPEDKHGVVT